MLKSNLSLVYSRRVSVLQVMLKGAIIETVVSWVGIGSLERQTRFLYKI